MTDPGTTTTVQLTREYIAGGRRTFGLVHEALPQSIDDLTVDLSLAIYERMMLDAAIAAATTQLRVGIVQDDMQVVSAVSDRDADGYDRAAELARECEMWIGDLTTPMDEVAWSLSAATCVGSRLAEVTWDTSATRWQPVKIATKRRDRYSYVVDVYDNFLGVLALRPDTPGSTLPSGAVLADLKSNPNFIERDKLLVVSFRPDADIRGTSVLRPAYNAYYLKQQLWGEFYRYLLQFASPLLIGNTAELATTKDGITPEQAMLSSLLELGNGTAAAFPFGAMVQALEVSGEGNAFLNGFALFDRQMTMAILTQTQATMESEHQSRASSDTQLSVMDKMLRQARRSMEQSIRRQLLRQWVRLNYGEATLPLTPYLSFGTVQMKDVASLWSALANLKRANYLDVSQYPDLDTYVNLPRRSLSDLDRRQSQADTPPPPPTAPVAPNNEDEEDEDDDNATL